jgi:flavodoxin
LSFKKCLRHRYLCVLRSPGVKPVKPIVIYASKRGNTRKIAEAISQELSCQAIDVTQPNGGSIDLDSYDLIFVGTGIHYGNPNVDLTDYLKTTNATSPKVFALFVTWGGAGMTNQNVIGKLKAVLASKGCRVIEDYFMCFGGWNLLRRGHPNNADANAARVWAKKLADQASAN